MHIHKLEKVWLTLGIGSLFIFLIIIGINAFAMGNEAPSHMDMIDPQKVEQTPPFDHPGLKKIGEKTYEADIVAMTFGYSPNKIQVPLGSKVIFKVASKDVVHSFTIPGTNVNMMLTPGYINSSEHTFNELGSHLVLCNEYCGAGHQLMKMEIEVVK